MKFTLTFLFLLCGSLIASASGRITASITVTNSTTNGMTFVVNSDTRTFTNQVFNPASQVLTNSDVSGSGSKTNLYRQIGLTPISQLVPTDTGSNTFQLVGPCGYNFTVTATALASVTYSTQVCSVATPVGTPFSAYYPNPASGTNVASQLVLDLNNYDTNALSQNARITGQLTGTSNTQVIYGEKYFINQSNIFMGGISNALWIMGNLGNLTNGSLYNTALNNPTLTNGVNTGQAFSSRGSGDTSEQFGDSAQATGSQSMAIGQAALASADSALAIGQSSVATNANAVALGANAFSGRVSGSAIGSSSIVRGDNGTAVGNLSDVEAGNATAIGYQSIAAFTNSTAVGFGATTTTSNQVMLGSPGSSTVVPNSLSVGTNESVGGNVSVAGNSTVTGWQTNGNFTGNNTFSNAAITFSRFAISSLANGNNAAVPIGTNMFVEVSGPSAPFSINGVASSRDGKLIIMLNQSGQVMTIANESGIDPVASNRIRTLTGADLATSPNSICTFIYNGNVSRWILLSAGTVSTVTNIAGSQITGAISPTALVASGLPTNSPVFYSGTTNIGNLATSLVVAIGHTMPNTNYTPSVTIIGGALAASTTPSCSVLTTNSFTLNLSAGIAGGDQINWSVIYSP